MVAVSEVVDRYRVETELRDGMSGPLEVIAGQMDAFEGKGKTVAETARQFGKAMAETGTQAARAVPDIDRIANRVDTVTKAQRSLSTALDALRVAQAAATREGATDAESKAKQERTLAGLAAKVEDLARKLGAARAEAEANQAMQEALNGTYGRSSDLVDEHVAALSAKAQAEHADQAAMQQANQAAQERASQVQRLTGLLNGYVQLVDPLAAKLARVEAAEQSLTAARTHGVAVTEEQAAAVAKMRASYEAAATDQARLLNGSKAAEEAAAQAAKEHASEVQRLQAALTGYVHANDPLAASLARVQAAEQNLTAARTHGIAVTEEQAAAVAKMRAGYEAAAADQVRVLNGSKAAEEAAAQAAKAHASEVQRLQAALTGYVQANDPVAASLAKVIRAEEELAQLRSLGIPATLQQSETVVRMRREHEELAASSGKVGNSFGLQRHQVQNLTAQFVDLGVQVSSGGGILLPLIQQGPQAVDAVGGVRAAVGLLGQVFTPARIAIGLGVVALGAMTIAGKTQEANLASLRGQLRGVSGDYAAMAEEVERSARRIQASGQGISRDEARASQVQLRQSAGAAGIGGLDFEQLSKDAADLAVVLRTDLAGASTELGKAMKDPAALVEQLAAQGFPGMTEQLRITAAAMVAGGDRTSAFELVLGRVMDRARGAAKDVDPLKSSLRELGIAWDGFTDTVGPWLAGAGATLLSWLTDFARLVGAVVGAIQSVGNLRLPRIDPNGGGNTSAVTSGAAYAGASDFNTALARQESGGNSQRENPYGYLGTYQYGSARLQDLGVYTPRAGEGANSWQGSFNIPGFAGVTSKTDFLANAQAQEAVRQLDTAALMPTVQKILQDNPDKVIGGIGLNAEGLLAVAHLGGKTGMERFVAAGGQGESNRRDANGTSLLDYYAAFSKTGAAGPVTVQATRVELTGTGGIVLPPVSVEASADQTLDKALRLARGQDSPYAPNTTRETQAAGINRALQQIDAARQIPGLDAASMDVLVAGTRRLRAELEGLKGPHAEFVRGQQDAIQSAEQLDPVQRAVNEAVRGYTDQMERAGETPSAGQLEEVRANKLRELQAVFKAATSEIDRQTASQERIGVAYVKGEQAVARATAAEKAMELVRSAGIKGTEARKVAEEGVTEALLRQQRVNNDNAALAANSNSEANLEYLAKQRDLIGASADMRERELAAMKVRQDLERRPGGTSEPIIQQAEALARQTADATRETRQLANSWSAVENFASQTADTIQNALVSALASGEAKTIKFGAIWRATMAAAVSQASQLAIINPLLNAAFGGDRATLGGVATVASGSGSPITTDGKGNLVGYAQQGAQAYSAYSKLSGINPTSYINGTSSFATGWGGLDAALNTPIWGASSGINAGGAVTNAAGYGSMAQSSIDAAGSASSAGVGGLTYGGAAMGALGVAGGLYGAYSGIQRGGPGGYTSAAGGAATAGLSAAAMAGMSVPVYGWVAAMALMVLGALLPGQKPSDMTGAATFTTNDPGNPVIGGLGGVRYSEANREQARLIGVELGKLADQVGEKTGLNRSVETAYRVEWGNRDGLNVYMGADGRDQLHGATDEEGVAAVTQAFISRLLQQAAQQTPDANIRSIIDRTGVADPDATLANIDWYENTWKVMQEPLEATRSGLETFEAQLKDLQAPFQEVINKSIALGLATEELTKRQQEAVDYARGQVAQGYDQAMWQAQGRGYIQSLRDIRENYETNSSLYRNVGRNPEDLYNQQAIAALSSLSVDALRDVAANFVGWDDAMASLAQQMLANTEATMAATAATEAARNRDQAQQNVVGTLGGITDFVRSLQFGDQSVLSPEAQLNLASQQFEDLAARAQTGDYGAISDFTEVSGNLLNAGRDYYASGPGYAALQERVLSLAETIGNISVDTLTSSAMESIMQTTAQTIVEAINRLLAESQLTRVQIAGMLEKVPAR
jgi:hypothetical protein